MKKLVLLATVAALSIMLVACGGDGKEKVNESAESNQTVTEGFTWEADGVELSIDATKEETVDKITEEAEYFESPSCAYEGTDKIYSYNNYTVTFYEGDGEDGISLITLTSDLVSTAEGLSVGSTKEEVLAEYGEPAKDDKNLVVYEKGKTELRFILKDDEVVSVEYAKVF